MKPSELCVLIILSFNLFSQKWTQQSAYAHKMHTFWLKSALGISDLLILHQEKLCN